MQQLIKTARKHWQLITVLLVFGIVYSLISLVNHYNFRTYALDLGNKNLEMWDYAHFQWNKTTLRFHVLDNKLADHFSFTPMLMAPFIFLFGTYTALIFQILAILLGGVGIYQLMRHKAPNKQALALWATVHFLSMWAICSALSFDYHDNVVAAMLVPWFFYFVLKKNWKATIILYLLIISAKENMALWMGFVSMGSLFVFKDKESRKPLLLLTGFSFVYFVLVIKLVMPAISGGNYEHFKYEALGADFGEAIKTILSRPQYIFTLLFENHIHQKVGFGIKSELHLVVLLSGGFVFLYRPQYLLMLLPIYAQKLFNDNFTKWGINYQYSIEFAPILTIGLFFWLAERHAEHRRLARIAFGLALLSFGVNFAMINSRVSKWFNPERIRFHQAKHYQQTYDIAKVYSALELIPNGVPVSAQTMLCPHLALRNNLYQFPNIADAEYVALITADDNTYPATKDEYLAKIHELKAGGWEAIIENETILILKK